MSFQCIYSEIVLTPLDSYVTSRQTQIGGGTVMMERSTLFFSCCLLTLVVLVLFTSTTLHDIAQRPLPSFLSWSDLNVFGNTNTFSSRDRWFSNRFIELELCNDMMMCESDFPKKRWHKCQSWAESFTQRR